MSLTPKSSKAGAAGARASSSAAVSPASDASSESGEFPVAKFPLTGPGAILWGLVQVTTDLEVLKNEDPQFEELYMQHTHKSKGLEEETRLYGFTLPMLRSMCIDEMVSASNFVVDGWSVKGSGDAAKFTMKKDLFRKNVMVLANLGFVDVFAIDADLKAKSTVASASDCGPDPSKPRKYVPAKPVQLHADYFRFRLNFKGCRAIIGILLASELFRFSEHGLLQENAARKAAGMEPSVIQVKDTVFVSDDVLAYRVSSSLNSFLGMFKEDYEDSELTNAEHINDLRDRLFLFIRDLTGLDADFGDEPVLDIPEGNEGVKIVKRFLEEVLGSYFVKECNADPVWSLMEDKLSFITEEKAKACSKKLASAVRKQFSASAKAGKKSGVKAKATAASTEGTIKKEAKAAAVVVKKEAKAAVVAVKKEAKAAAVAVEKEAEAAAAVAEKEAKAAAAVAEKEAKAAAAVAEKEAKAAAAAAEKEAKAAAAVAEKEAKAAAAAAEKEAKAAAAAAEKKAKAAAAAAEKEAKVAAAATKKEAKVAASTASTTKRPSKRSAERADDSEGLQLSDGDIEAVAKRVCEMLSSKLVKVVADFSYASE